MDLRHRHSNPAQGRRISSSRDITPSSSKEPGILHKRLGLTPLLLLFIASILGLSIPLLYSSSSFNAPPPPPDDDKTTPESVPQNSSLGLKTPHCHLLSSDAIRALRRAKTSFCRDQIALIACHSQNGTLYTHHHTPLSNECPNHIDSSIAGKHLGCFLDSVSSRLLPEKLFKFKDDNSPSKCMNSCAFYGFLYAGVQYKKECFCGNKAPKEDPVDDSRCDLACPKAEDGFCGGYLSMNVYHTGLVLSEPPMNLNEVGGEQPRIVFLLTLSGRSLRQVKRLLKRIYNPYHYYFIHVDSRQEYLHRELSVLESQNLKLVPKRFATIWGGSSLLSMLLSSMEILVKQENWDWDFVLNLSESDYPLKPISDLTDFLRRNMGRNFVKSHGRDSSVFIQKQGLERTFFECENRMWRIGNRKLPSKGITLDGGSDWICLHKEFISHLIHNMETDQTLSSLRLLYNYTLLPAESFFHTVLRNSKFCSTYVNNNLHLTNWKRKLGCKCQHKAVVDWCGCSPNDITPLDWAKVKGSKDKDLYFVRKVEPVVSQSILDLIDSELLGINEVVDDRYWQNFYHHLDVNGSGGKEVDKRLAVYLLPPESTLLEVHSFHKNDSFLGILILFRLKDSVNNELWISPRSLSVLIELESSEYFVSLEVGSSFDPKELIFRNFFRAFDDETNMGVKITYRSFEDKKVTFLLMDPSGSIAKIFSSKLNKTEGLKSPPLVQYEEFGAPDMDGHWRLIPLIDGRVEKGIGFMVNMGEGPPSIQMDRERPGILREILPHKNISELIPLSFPHGVLQDGMSKAQLLAEYYRLKDTCLGLRNCSLTSWSSCSYDSKSDLQNFSLYY